MEHVERMMKRVQALLDRADHAGTTEHEAAACRAKAEDIMVKYRIEESALGLMNKDQSKGPIKPVWRDWWLVKADNQFSDEYWQMFCVIAQHVGLRFRGQYAVNPEEDGVWLGVQAVGYESDLWYALSIFNGVRLTFASKLEPTVDKGASDQDNVYALRNSGATRIRIAEVLWGDESQSATAKVSRLYEAACKARDEDPVVAGRTVNAKTYRKSYAEAFVYQIGERLYEMRIGARETASSGELVLSNRKENVDEAFYAKFPSLRPQPRKEGQGFRMCAKCQAAKSGYCRAHKPRTVQGKRSAVGQRAGRRAANEADLTGGRNPTGKINNAKTGELS